MAPPHRPGNEGGPALNGAGPDAPSVASARAYLRGGLPAIYTEGDFGMRFVGALETLLDPIVALLDSLPAYFDPDLAPADMVDLMASWLGIELDESWPEERRRELVRSFAELSRRRGTRQGLERSLRIAFPDLPLRVEDAGSVHWAAEESALPEPAAAGFVVYCDKPVEHAGQAAIARMIELAKPVGVVYRLRVKQRSGGGEGA